MRAKTLSLIFLCGLTCLPAPALAQKTRPVLLVLPAPSTWKSQSGTLVVLAVSNGVINGTFTSSAAACGPTPTPITGKVASQKISFAAMFPSCNTIMWWRGGFTEQAIGTGLTKFTIQPNGTVASIPSGDLFARQ